MHQGMRDLDTAYIVLDEGGAAIPCQDMSAEDLIQAAASARSVRPARAGKIAGPMLRLAQLLAAVSGARNNGQPDLLHHMIQNCLNEIHQTCQLRVLAGLSPDELTVFVAFVKPWTGRCLVEANVDP
jgi:hypothetical protein